jgi:hypothetical protein
MSIFIIDKPLLSSEKMFHKDYGHIGLTPQKMEKALVVSHKRLDAKTN